MHPAWNMAKEAIPDGKILYDPGSIQHDGNSFLEACCRSLRVQPVDTGSFRKGTLLRCSFWNV